jgi:hypothetical protein
LFFFSTPDTSHREGNEWVRQGKCFLLKNNGEISSSRPQPDSSTVSAGMDTQLQAQLVRVTELEQQLSKQIELAKASARVAQLEKQLSSLSVQVREDIRETIEVVGEQKA